MNKNDKVYKKVTNRIGISLIVFYFLYSVLFSILSQVNNYLMTEYGTVTVYCIAMLLQSAVYLTVFIVPALILRVMLRGQRESSMQLHFDMPKRYALLIPGVIAVCFAASYVNSYILTLFGVPDLYGMDTSTLTPYAPVQIILEFISMAIVPAVCEEFFFRGAIASSLVRFGRGAAVIGSAVLFGLMHQNPYQLLYTTVAGICMGYVYVKTGSILCSTLMHLANNGVSVLQSILLANFGEEVGGVLSMWLIVFIFALGTAGVVLFLFADKKHEENKFEGGCFERELDTDDGYVPMPVSPSKRIKYFFSPCVIVFICLVAINVGITWLSAILYMSGGGA